jgi:hypothetical protein
MQAADPNRMLPTDLRAAWLVVPRAFLLRLLLAGALLGAGIATTAVGFASGSSTLMVGLPVALIALRLLDVVRWPDDRAIDELPQRHPEVVDPQASARSDGEVDRSRVLVNSAFAILIGLGAVATSFGSPTALSRWALLLGLAALLMGGEAAVRAGRQGRKHVVAGAMIAVALGVLAVAMSVTR